MNKSILLWLLLLAPVLACVNNSLWVATASCTNCTNSSAAYNCFAWDNPIASGTLNSTWYLGGILNTTNATNAGFCYNNLNTSQLCTTNTTWGVNNSWTFNLNSISNPGNVFASCGLTLPGTYANTTCSKRAGMIFNTSSTRDDEVIEFWVNETVLYGCNYTNISRMDGTTFINYDTLVQVANGTKFNCYYRTHPSVAATNQSSLYLYYDCTTNTTSTYAVFADEFGAALNAAVWDLWGTPATGAGYLVLSHGAGDYGVQTKRTFNKPEYVLWRAKTDLNGWLVINRTTAVDAMGSDGYTVTGFYSNSYTLPRRNNIITYTTPPFTTTGANAVMYSPVSIADNTDYYYKLIANSTGGYQFFGATGTSAMINSTSTNILNATGTKIHLTYGDAAGSDTSFDFIRVYNEDANTFATAQTTFYGLNTTETVTGLPYTNYTVFTPVITQNYGYYTANIKNELDNSAWNMNHTQNETITFICETSQSIQNLTSNSMSFILSDTPRVVKVDVNFTATGDTYYRKQVPTTTYPNTESQNFYLVNLNDTTLVQVILTLQDWTGLFSGSEVIIKRPILSSGVIQITSDLFDAEKKAIFYLIKDMEYQISVYKDGVMKSIGYLIIDSDTSKTITVADISFNSDTIKQFEDIIMSAWMDANYIIGTYNDTSGTTSNVVFSVYNYTDDSLLYTTTSPCSLCSFSWNYSQEYSTPYMVNILATNSNLTTSINSTWLLNYYNVTSYLGEGTLARSTFNWVAVIILVSVSLAVGYYSLPAGSILFLILSMVMYWIGWLMVPIYIILFAGVFLIGIAIASKKVND